MITAKEVLEITKKQNCTKEKILEELEKKILVCAHMGYNNVTIFFSESDVTFHIGHNNRYHIKQTIDTILLLDIENTLVGLGYKTLSNINLEEIELKISWNGELLF